MFRRAFVVAAGLALGAAPVMAQGMGMHRNSAMSPQDTASSAESGWGGACPYAQMMGTPYGMMGMMGSGMYGQGMYGRGMYGQGRMGSGMYGQGMYGQGINGQGMYGRGMMGSGYRGAPGYPMMGGGPMGFGGMPAGGLVGPQQLVGMSERLGLSADQVSDLQDVQARAFTAAQNAMSQAAEARTRAVTTLEQNPSDFEAYADALRDVSTDITEANVAMARASFEARDLLTKEQRASLQEILGQWGNAPGSGMMGGGRMGPPHHSGRLPNPAHR